MVKKSTGIPALITGIIGIVISIIWYNSSDMMPLMVGQVIKFRFSDLHLIPFATKIPLYGFLLLAILAIIFFFAGIIDLVRYIASAKAEKAKNNRR